MDRVKNWLALGTLAIFSSTALAEEWPKWMGPDGTNISHEKIATQWPADGPAKVWTAKVGRGFSSIVARDAKVYSIAMQGSNDVLSAFEADSGKMIWAQSYP